MEKKKELTNQFAKLGAHFFLDLHAWSWGIAKAPAQVCLDRIELDVAKQSSWRWPPLPGPYSGQPSSSLFDVQEIWWITWRLWRALLQEIRSPRTAGTLDRPARAYQNNAATADANTGGHTKTSNTKVMRSSLMEFPILSEEEWFLSTNHSYVAALGQPSSADFFLWFLLKFFPCFLLLFFL